MSSDGHASSVSERTLLTCTPIPLRPSRSANTKALDHRLGGWVGGGEGAATHLCTPEHSIQKVTPRLTLHHVGSTGESTAVHTVEAAKDVRNWVSLQITYIGTAKKKGKAYPQLGSRRKSCWTG
jgi:hypothetical protein